VEGPGYFYRVRGFLEHSPDPVSIVVDAAGGFVDGVSVVVADPDG